MWNITSRQRPRAMCANLEMIFMWRVALRVTNISFLLPVGGQNREEGFVLENNACIYLFFYLIPFFSLRNWTRTSTFSTFPLSCPLSPRLVPPLPALLHLQLWLRLSFQSQNRTQLYDCPAPSPISSTHTLPQSPQNHKAVHYNFSMWMFCFILLLSEDQLRLKSFKEPTKYASFLLWLLKQWAAQSRAECSKLNLTIIRRYTTSFMINDSKPMEKKTCDAFAFENFKCIHPASPVTIF